MNTSIIISHKEIWLFGILILIKVLHLIEKTSIFPESSQLYCVAPDKSTEAGRQQRESFTEPKWKNYDFTMFWSRITASHGIAVK
ncbi:MAG: hypothetical protein PUI10_05950 [Prevotellaceae bacterium]|nr:hypothetical protein [Prevotellaceae bacterium]